MLRFSLALLIALAGVANAQVKSISPQQKNPAPHDPRNIIKAMESIHLFHSGCHLEWVKRE